MVEQVKKDSFIERKIILNMITSESYLKNIQGAFKPEFIITKAGRNIAKWCMDYYNQYKTAPKKEVEYFINNICLNKADDEEAKDYIRIIDSLDKEYDSAEEYNEVYLLDRTFDYFKERSLVILSDSIRSELVNGNTSKAEEVLLNHVRVEKPQSDGVDLFSDEALDGITELISEPLVELPNDYGLFLNSELYRSAFVCFLAPAKRGKTYCMLDIAGQALLQGKKVAIMQMGDLSVPQTTQRLMSYLYKRSYVLNNCKEAYYPVLDCQCNQNGNCPLKRGDFFNQTLPQGTMGLDKADMYKTICDNNYHRCTLCNQAHDYNVKKNFKPSIIYGKREETKPLTTEYVKRTRETYFKGLYGNCKICAYPNGTCSPNDVALQLDKWAVYDNFIPDILVIDYIDIMRSDKFCRESRDERNNIVKGLRRITQAHNVCIISATQADTEGMEKTSLSRTNFNGDRRILDDITTFIAINQTEGEKEKGIVRLSKIVSRDDSMSSVMQLHILQDLNIGRYRLESYLAYHKDEDKEENKKKYNK